MSDPHPPRSRAPSRAVLSSGALVRDVTSGETQLAEAWIAGRAAAEGRSYDECAEALMNAIARGDIVVEGATAADGRDALGDDAEAGGP